MNHPAAELRGIRMVSGLFDSQQAAGNPTQKRLVLLVGQVGILQTRSEIGRTHRLRHADSDFTGCPGVAVGHVGSPFLRMRQNASYAELLELEQCVAQNRLHEKDIGDAVIMERLGEIAGAGQRLRYFGSPFQCHVPRTVYRSLLSGPGQSDSALSKPPAV